MLHSCAPCAFSCKAWIVKVMTVYLSVHGCMHSIRHSCCMDGDRPCARSNWQVRSGRWNSFMLSCAGSGVCCGHVQHAHVHEYVHVHGRMSSASDEFPHELFPSLLLHAWIRQTDYSDALSNHVCATSVGSSHGPPHL